jgi:hypothetical protein
VARRLEGDLLPGTPVDAGTLLRPPVTSAAASADTLSETLLRGTWQEIFEQQVTATSPQTADARNNNLVAQVALTREGVPEVQGQPLTDMVVLQDGGERSGFSKSCIGARAFTHNECCTFPASKTTDLRHCLKCRSQAGDSESQPESMPEQWSKHDAAAHAVIYASVGCDLCDP